jgi:hypothetical protein
MACALILAVCFAPVRVHAQTGNPGPAGTVFPAGSPLNLHDTGVLGDFDGDRRPDIAIARPERLSNGAFRYRVEVLLSTQPAGAFDVEFGPAGGLHISAQDVDGDRDLDLVITSEFGRQPVGIWINDGHGRFTRGAAEKYPKSVWQEASQVFERLAPPNRPAVFAVSGSGGTPQPTGAVPALRNQNSLFSTPTGVRALFSLNPGSLFRAPPIA